MELISQLLLLAASLTIIKAQCSSPRFQITNPVCTSIADTACSQFYSHATFSGSEPNALNATRSTLERYRLAFDRLDCSQYAAIYFCLSLMPQCDPTAQGGVHYLRPCASLCQLIINSCNNSINSLGIGQSLDVNCLLSSCSTRFPSDNCIDAENAIVRASIATQPTSGSTEPSPLPPTTTDSSPITDDPRNSSTIYTCPLPNNTFFTGSSKSFALGWVSFWSVLCFLSTTLTILTFLLDTSRFQYPWRPVIFLALVFNLHSFVYFFSAALGRRIVTCPNGRFVESGDAWSWAHTPCILIFIFHYYTMMAAFIWWVILTICWFLVSALQWSHEAVTKLALFFHASAWILPLLMTISLMAARVIGADELTATCFVVSNGTTSSFLALLIGVIVPLVILLCVGVTFLILGFVGILRIRSFMRRGGKQQEQQILEKLMIRIGIFVAVYIVPASVLVGCFIYELASRASWVPLSEDCPRCPRPNSAVFMVRVFMFLLIGILTGIWIWSRKTIQSWQKLPEKCATCCSYHPDEKEEARPSAENVISIGMPSYSYPDSGLDST